MSVEVLGPALLSLRISLVAVLVATVIGMPIGVWLGGAQFRGREVVVVATNTLMAIPTVLIGLLVYGLLSRQGPLGPLAILYTPLAMTFGEALLALPIIIALSRGAIETLDPRVRETALTLGARPLRLLRVLVIEARPTLSAAVFNAFGRVISEIGIALMVGGNIRGETRTLTTAMALATQLGDFPLAVQLGVVLLFVALLVMVSAELVKR